MSFSWENAARNIRASISREARKPPLPPGYNEKLDIDGAYRRLDAEQCASLAWMAERLPWQRGIVLADEVGLGKTRIACAVVHAVLAAGGRAAVVVPRGLMHQWAAESRLLLAGSPKPKEATTVKALLDAMAADGGKNKDLFPRADQPEWWLISHGFRAPLVRGNANPWRVALPAFALAAGTERQDGRTWIGKLQREIDSRHASPPEWPGMARIARDIGPRVRGCPDLIARIQSLPPLNLASGNNDALIATFGPDGEGRVLTEELLGLWLGAFDLLVIDEAHKSRDDGDAEDAVLGATSGNVLSRLVRSIVRQDGEGRRLCVTATPMELDLSQWLDLLARARVDLDREQGRRVVARLREAARCAVDAPDEGGRLDEVCAAARDFTTTLAPYVTRRRRETDPVVAAFRARVAVPDGAPHPHRRLERVTIGWADAAGRDSPWTDVLFAAECMSESARGLTKADTTGWPHAVRDAYTKLSAGHVIMDPSDDRVPFAVPAPDAADDHTRGKIARVAYWYRRLHDGRTRVMEQMPRLHGVDPAEQQQRILAEHPRILAAVDEIESWTRKGEKVLVFGVFLNPLKLLRDVLNVRHALRAADGGKPIERVFEQKLHGVALHQLERLRAEGALTGRLATGGDDAMQRALADGSTAYEHLRPRVRERARRAVSAWRNGPAPIRGVQFDDELQRLLEDHLTSFVIDELLVTTSAEDELSAAGFDKLSQDFLEERLRPLLGGDDEDEEHARRRGKPLVALLKDDDVRQSPHARLLHGETDWQTRRYLQAAFNRSGYGSRVLVAQSQVGREGLNLHEACRVVVQFHAEWNPAVLEQQIGRVDRKGSLWERRAQKWMDEGAQGEPPFVEVRQLIFEGTYDSFQWDRVTRRQHAFDASLFGALLPAEAWHRMPKERVTEVREAAPSFRPPPTK